MIHSISSTPFICENHIQRHLAPQIVSVTCHINCKRSCIKVCFKCFKVHLTDEGWQEESYRVLEQLTKMHGHHTSSGVWLEHGDSIPMCASLDGVCVLQWGMIYRPGDRSCKALKVSRRTLNGHPFPHIVGNRFTSIWVWYDQTFSSSLAIVQQHFISACSRFRHEKWQTFIENCYKSQIVRWWGSELESQLLHE